MIHNVYDIKKKIKIYEKFSKVVQEMFYLKREQDYDVG